MASDIALWMIDQTLGSLVGSVLTEAGYSVSFIDEQAITGEANKIEGCKLLFVDVEIVQKNNEIKASLEKLRKLNGCKILILTKSEFYPLVREGRFHQLADRFLFYPVDRGELIGNAERYL